MSRADARHSEIALATPPNEPLNSSRLDALGVVASVAASQARPEGSDLCLQSRFAMNRRTVYINGRFLTQRVTGVQRYCRELLLALDQELAARPELLRTRWVVIAPTGTKFPELKVIECQALGGGSGNLWEQGSLYWHTRRDLLISFGNTGPLLHGRQIITVHDASVYRVPDAFNWRFRLWYQGMVNWIVRRAKSSFAVSEFAKSECIRFYGAKEERICVCTEGWQHLDRVQPTSDAEIRTMVGPKPTFWPSAARPPIRILGWWWRL